MADYTEEDLGRAREIVESLRSSAREGPERIFKGDLEDGLSVADLQGGVEEFYDELQFVAEAGFDFPAVHIDGVGNVPVALSEAMPGYRGQFPLFWSRFWRDFVPRRYVYDVVYRELRGRMRRFGEKVNWLNPSEADKTFFDRASEFLSARIAGQRMLRDGGLPPGGPPPTKLTMQKYIGGPPTQVAGCMFSVHTQSSNLSAYWSGAYLVSSNNHGAPTTPAIGPLQAGTYIFGVDGGAYGSTVQWDFNKVCTLPGASSVHLLY